MSRFRFEKKIKRKRQCRHSARSKITIAVHELEKHTRTEDVGPEYETRNGRPSVLDGYIDFTFPMERTFAESTKTSDYHRAFYRFFFLFQSSRTPSTSSYFRSKEPVYGTAICATPNLTRARLVGSIAAVQIVSDTRDFANTRPSSLPAERD